MFEDTASSTWIRTDSAFCEPFGIGSGPLIYSGRSPLLMVEQGRSDPCLGMVWADTDHSVYQIEINEINAQLRVHQRALVIRERAGPFHQCFCTEVRGACLFGLNQIYRPRKNLERFFPLLSKDPFRHWRLKGPPAEVQQAEVYAGRGGRRRETGGLSGNQRGRSDQDKRNRSLGRPVWGVSQIWVDPGDLPGVDPNLG